MAVEGRGWGSNFLWAFDDALFFFPSPTPLSHLTLSNFAIASVVADKTPSSFAFAFPAGVVKSNFDNILLLGQGDVPATSLKASLIGGGFDLGAVTDTVALRDNLLWFVRGVGVRVGRGSEVRISGGRIIGPKWDVETAIGGGRGRGCSF
jgi:hypothetical protein